jgi:hypothetical protein
MKAKFLTMAVLTGAGLLLGSAPAAMANSETYDFVFTSGGMDATGTITVDSGVAEVGSISVTGIPIEHPVAGDTTPFTLTGIPLIPLSRGESIENLENHNGDVLTADNLVFPTSNPVLDSDGLDFGSGQYGTTYYNTIINLWGNSPGSYSLFVGEAGTHFGGVYDSEFVYTQSNGNLTLTPVPDASSSLVLLSSSCLALGIVRRKLTGIALDR